MTYGRLSSRSHSCDGRYHYEKDPWIAIRKLTDSPIDWSFASGTKLAASVLL